MRALLAEKRKVGEIARATVGLSKQWALRHAEYRLEAEAGYLIDLLGSARSIVTEESLQKTPKRPKPDRSAQTLVASREESIMVF